MLIIFNAIAYSVYDRWDASDTGRTARKICPKLDERRIISLLKLHRGALNVVIGVVTEHCIMGTHARRIALGHVANNFCRSCRDEADWTVPHLLAS